jgi:hypothetical protein
MAEWNSPAQLVGWGDSAGTSVLSFSGVGAPWDWPVENDVAVGGNPSDPIISVIGYDDQLVIFKNSSIVGYPGFKELSISNGLVGGRAVVGLYKVVYWLDVDGVYQMARRDFLGYSVEKISAALDPVFNAWDYTTFSADVVPFKINPAYRHLSVLTYNQRDQHLYLFFPEGTSAENNRCLTYDVQGNKWDGFFTLKASDAAWITMRDTSRVVMGCPDSAMITGLDYAYNDPGATGIDGTLLSGRFWISGGQADAWPVETIAQRVRFLGRSLQPAIDSAWVIMVGDDRSDTLDMTFNTSWGDVEQIWRLSGDNKSEFWQWKMQVFSDSIVGLFVPYQLDMEFSPVTRDD